MSTTLQQAVQRLALARQAEAFASEALRVKRDAFAAENAALIATEKEMKLAVAQAEADVRALGLAAYNATKDKAPMGGVTIKLFTRLRYDATRAFQWAKEKAMCLVPEQLDVAAFEKVAKATTLDFVTIDQEPQVTIAKDLTAYLPTDETRDPVTSVESQHYIDTGERPAKDAPLDVDSYDGLVEVRESSSQRLPRLVLGGSSS